MNYRDLVNDFAIETQSFDKIATVIGQRDDELQGVTWVRDAWVQIQRAEGWDFMRVPYVMALEKGTYMYAPEIASDIGGSIVLDTFGYRESIDPLRDYYHDVAPVSYIHWDSMRTHLGQGAESFGRPRRVSLRPDKSLFVSPTPDEDGFLLYEIYSAPVFLTDDLDVPSMPEAYHKAIVYLAVKNYAREQGKEWTGLYTSATREFNHIYNDMLRFYLPAMKPTVPLIR